MFLWPLAWFLMGIGLLIGDVYSEPRRGPLWAALILGALGWGAAGGCPRSRGRTPWRWPLGLAWTVLFPAALLVGLRWAELAELLGGAGFEGLIAAFALAGALGGLLTGIATPERSRGASRPVLGISAAGLFGVLFLIGSYVGTLGSYLLADLVEGMLGGLLGNTTALALGFGLGWALGGLAAGAAAASIQAAASGD